VRRYCAIKQFRGRVLDDGVHIQRPLHEAEGGREVERLRRQFRAARALRDQLVVAVQIAGLERERLRLVDPDIAEDHAADRRSGHVDRELGGRDPVVDDVHQDLRRDDGIARGVAGGAAGSGGRSGRSGRGLRL
jgi:hypothetical protein